MAKEEPAPSKDQKPPTRFVLRAAVAILLCALVTLYTAGVVSGFVDEERRIDVVNLAMIALAVFCAILLLMPDVFEGMTVQWRPPRIERDLDWVLPRPQGAADTTSAGWMTSRPG